jgi:hypothetical protein
MTIARGVFTSSLGPMTVTAGITLVGGLLSGAGSVDSLTSRGGTVAPGGSNPGTLTVDGAVVFNSATTLSIQLSGTDAGTGYSQLAAGGPIYLGGSTLSLNIGFAPPVGATFEILTNTGSVLINGTFNGLDEGSVLSQGGYQFQISYHAGMGGNSLVLTRFA